MARSPMAKARVSGADAKNPQRYRGRNDPTVAPLGEPSAYLTAEQRAAWHSFLSEIPWLVAADRALVEVAAIMRARFQSSAGELGINQVQVYSAVLSKLGASPVDRSRTTTPANDEPDEGDEFFGPN